MTTYRAIVGVVLFFFAGTIAATANEVGFMPGAFSVGKQGEATYQIPIDLPPGAGGLQPDLGLVYNSHGRNGPLGIGWSISGLSVITRCPATLEQDGLAGAVRYQSGDRFCLDGQRLMKIQGTYGENNSRYRTEIESFQDIYAYDDNTDEQIDKFLVRDKTGLTRYYGYTATSRIEAQGKTYARVWMLNKVVDKFGNYFEVDYAEQTAAGLRGEFWVTNVYYRNSDHQNLGRIEFHYADRSDASFGYSYAGSRIATQVLLNRIDVYGHDQSNNWSRARQYELNYENNAANGISQLIAVQECDAAATSCLPPTRMNYFHGENGFDTENIATLPTHISNQFMDVNGDGRVDQVYELNYRWTIRLSGSHDTPHITTIDSAAQAHGTQYTRVFDHNGDGRQDLLVANTTTGRWEVLESTGTNFVLRDTGRPHLDAYQTQPMVMDLDGDALPEIVFKHNGWLKFYKNNGGTYSGPIDTELRVSSPQVLTPLEYDGDGRPDIVVNMDGCSSSGGPGGPGDPGWPWHPRGQHDKHSISVRGTTHCSETAGILTWSPAESNLVQLPMTGLNDTTGIGGETNHNRLLDFNGDGLTDLAVAPTTDTGQWNFYVNTGAGWQHVWSGYNGINRDKVAVFDYDGDGRQELWQPTASFWYRLQPDVSESDISFSPMPSGPFTNDRGFFMDWTGDGLGDLVISQGSSYYIRPHRGSKRGLLKSIENGLGDETHIAYVSMSDMGAGVVYSGETGTPAFPDRHYRPPMYLVRSVAADSGLLSPTGSDLKVTTNYSYYGAKLNQHGRGFLGFSKIEAHNVNTEIVTYNTHSQEFPYIGMVTRSEQWTPDAIIQDIDWEDIEDEFEPCLPASGPCTHPRSTSDQTRGGKGPGSVTHQRTTVIPGEKLSETQNTLAKTSFDVGGEGERYAPYISVSNETQFKYRTAEVMRRSITTSDYDDYGNHESITVTVDDGAGNDVHRVSTTNNYQNWSDERWCLGRLMSTTVTHERNDNGSGGPLSETRESAFNYHSSTCQLIQEITEPQSAAWKMQTDYAHDNSGNRISVSVSGPGIATRTTTATYDEFGQFPLVQSNPLGHRVHTTWDYTFGHALATTDVNGFVSTVEYDTLGRRTREVAPRNTLWTEFDSVWCGNTGCDANNAIYKTLTKASAVTAGDRVQLVIEHDQLGREVLRKTRAFDGSYIYSDTHYDSAGRPFATSTPHYAHEVPCWTVNQYDNIGRLVAEYKPAETQDCINYGSGLPLSSDHTEIHNAYGNLTTYDHDGLETQVTDAQGRVVTRAVNVMDRLMSVSERDNDDRLLETRYDYDPLGNTTWVRDALGNISRMEYNLRGLKISMDDPDLGHWEYGYNTLGELIWQKDAKNQITTIEYDALGRMTRRNVAEGLTSWYYDDPLHDEDPAYHGASVGKVTRITGPNAYLQLMRYTGSFGELTQNSERLDGIWYYNDFGYDAYGRVDSTLAPAVGYVDTDSAARRLQLTTVFNGYGFPYLVREYRDQVNQSPLWRAVRMDALGNVIEQQTHNDGVTTIRQYDRASGAPLWTTAGTNGSIQNNSYQWDAVGNLTTRSDFNQGWTERFFYDRLYRLNQVNLAATVGSSGDVVAINNYDAIGNLLCKDAIAGVNRETCSGGYRNYVYGSGNTSAAGDAGPHAVTRVSTSAGERTYVYDNNGNVTNVTDGGGSRGTTWYSFNKPRKISRKDNSAEFWYRPDDRSRWKQVKVQGAETTTKYYSGGGYERTVRAGLADEHVYIVRAAGHAVAQIKRYGDSVGTSSAQYFHYDHLDSVIALSDDSGSVIEQMSYDAWGKRRSVTTWTAPGVNEFLYTVATQRGFTGHEHIDSLGLINMNGRVYDVEIGRFLSPDLFVQFPDGTQGLNRYAYVENNPLSYSDPSGFFLKGLIARIAGAIVTAVTGQAWLGHLVQGYLSSGADLKAMAIGFIVGSHGQSTYTTYQDLHSGIQARKNGGRFVNGLMRAMKSRIIGQIASIGQDYLIDTGTRIAASIRTASVSGTGPEGGGDRGKGSKNGAASDSFDNATKIDFEAYLGVKIKNWLEIGANEDKQFFLNARGKTVSIQLDQSGNLVFSAGNASTQVQIMQDDFELMARHVRDTFSIDLSVLGGSISVSETGHISWEAYLRSSGFLGKLGISAKAGLGGTFDPSELIRSTYVGQAGYQYRRGTTDHVDKCLKADFNLEGC